MITHQIAGKVDKKYTTVRDTPAPGASRMVSGKGGSSLAYSISIWTRLPWRAAATAIKSRIDLATRPLRPMILPAS